MFGEKAVNMDKFSLTAGYRKAAQETWDDPSLLSQKQKNDLQAYADGVNDFINGVGYFHEEITAFYLPLEFYALNLTQSIDPWTPIDSLALLRLINFHLSYNWS